jgi:hypothetical protein
MELRRELAASSNRANEVFLQALRRGSHMRGFHSLYPASAKDTQAYESHQYEALSSYEPFGEPAMSSHTLNKSCKGAIALTTFSLRKLINSEQIMHKVVTYELVYPERNTDLEMSK